MADFEAEEADGLGADVAEATIRTIRHRAGTPGEGEARSRAFKTAAAAEEEVSVVEVVEVIPEEVRVCYCWRTVLCCYA